MLPLKRSTDPRIVLYIWLTHARPLPKTVEQVFSRLIFASLHLWNKNSSFVHRPECRRLSCVTVWCFLIALLNMAGFMKFRSLIYLDFTRILRQQNLQFLISSWKLKKNRPYLFANSFFVIFLEDGMTFFSLFIKTTNGSMQNTFR
jgi:hypothetical protein